MMPKKMSNRPSRFSKKMRYPPKNVSIMTILRRGQLYYISQSK